MEYWTGRANGRRDWLARGLLADPADWIRRTTFSNLFDSLGESDDPVSVLTLRDTLATSDPTTAATQSQRLSLLSPKFWPLSKPPSLFVLPSIHIA